MKRSLPLAMAVWSITATGYLALGCFSTAAAAAAPGQPASAAATGLATGDSAWRTLSPSRRRALQPLEQEWRNLDLARRQKWLEIADRFPGLSADEQVRVQARMTEWARLSPEERGRTRLLFEQAKQVSPSDRGSKWDAYQALPDDERQQLAARAASSATATPVKRVAVRPLAASAAASAVGGQQGSTSDARSAAPKSNLVPNPAFAAPPIPVSPTVKQAGPGATTTLMSQRAEPPSHQQTGLPKITATSGFVDQTTLQPKRGPQAAATRPATASAPVPRP